MKRLVASALVCALALGAHTTSAAPLVWAIDDGEKIKEDDAPGSLAAGTGNPVWSPGRPVRLFAMRNETIAFQIVVAADDAPLEGVTVDLDALVSDEGARIANAPLATDPTRYVGRAIERFVEHFVEVPRASGGRYPSESLGWAAGSGPPNARWTGPIPDALIPVEVAPPWRPYPMLVRPRANGIVWIDLTIEKSQPPGIYRGDVVVRAGARTLATLPLVLDLRDSTLPDRPVKTMLFYHRSELERRIGDAEAERHLLRLLHRHRISPLADALEANDLARLAPQLDGSFYTSAAGYEGPAEGMGDGVLGLGAYGAFGAPDAEKIARVEAIADVLAKASLFATTDVFVYADDEACASPRGAAWKRLLAGSKNANVANVRVAWTCSEDAAAQPVDIAIQASTFDPQKTARARAAGKDVWAYNGHEPQTGTFLLDAPAVSPRVNGWLAATFGVGRWFYWEAAAWFDQNRGGHGAYDPFVTAETFHDADGDWAMGDGVLVYPGTQLAPFAARSIGMRGVIASIRLKSWRRGIEDAGYFQMARAADAARADAIAKALIPVAMSAARNGHAPSWPANGAPWFEARAALLALVPAGANGGGGEGASPFTPKPARAGCGSCRAARGEDAGLAIVSTSLFVALVVVRARRRRRARPSRDPKCSSW